ncbi:MAG: hypothetical protein FI729_06190 [SAR202 cluster bacterium]|nr:hypothetical protein [SAR202 cluster bacterium]
MSKIEQFPIGYKLEPVIFDLQDWEVKLYLQSAGETNPLFEDQKLVPPTAIAAFALRGVLKELELPPGAIHIAHEMSFAPSIKSDQSVIFNATLTQNAVRSGWRFVTIDFVGILATDRIEEEQVVNGRSTVVISEDSLGD